MPYVDIWVPALRAIHEAVLEAWPEVEGQGIWEITEAERIAYESMKFPRAHVDLPVADVWEDGPMTAVVYEQPAICYWMGQTEGGATKPFRVKTKVLQDRLLDPGLIDPVTGMEFTVLPHRFRAYCYANDEFQRILLLRNNSAQAGALAFSFLLGDNAA